MCDESMTWEAKVYTFRTNPDVYPATYAMHKMVVPIIDTETALGHNPVKYEALCAACYSAMHVVNEYEHGTADLEDVDLSTYISVSVDQLQSLLYTLEAGAGRS